MAGQPAMEIDYQFTPVPTEALERLAGSGLSGREFRIILAFWRKTWGWSKEKDKIPLSQFARLTGIDRRKCHDVLMELVIKKIIKKTVPARGDRRSRTYQFNINYAEWRLSPSMGTKGKKAETEDTVPLHGDTLSPSTGTKLSPSAAHSIDKQINKTESEMLPEFLKTQGHSLNHQRFRFDPVAINNNLPVDIEERRKLLREQAALLQRQEAREQSGDQSHA